MADAKQLRDAWVETLRGGSFAEATAKIESMLEAELASDAKSLRIHLGTCGVIPEDYGHDSTEEKVYSKYTDCVLAVAFRWLGLESSVIAARADSADVSARCTDFSLIADAKAFRLSRTAKNQKDFKIAAMATWRRDFDHALLVVPLHQVPTRKSQIYQQASEQKVAIASYAHAIALVELEGVERGLGARALQRLLQVPANLPASQEAKPYWAAAREAVVGVHARGPTIWQDVVVEAKQLLAVAREREIQLLEARARAIEGLSRDEAIEQLLASEKLSQRRSVIANVAATEVFDY